MRILAGTLKGRPITRPKTSEVRPISDKVRGALFDILRDTEGIRLLDVYAGSGAVGFEALSRGASRVAGIEASRSVANVIRENVVFLGIGDIYELHNQTVRGWLESPGSQSQEFNVIVADPPYAKIDWHELERLGKHLASSGILIISHSSRIDAPALQSLELIESRAYGDSTLTFYKNS